MKKIVVFGFIFIVFIVISYFIYYSLVGNMVLGEKLPNLNSTVVPVNAEELMSIDVFETTINGSNQYVKTSGKITSFHIENLSIETGEKVKELYVSDGSFVNAKQKIMLVSGYTNRTVKSTIQGLFFIVENENSANEYKIYDTSEIGLNVTIAEKDLPSIKIGQKAIVNIVALNKEIEGQVSHISKLPNSSGKFNVKIKIPYEESINFGYTASVKIEIASNENAMVIPYGSLCIDDEGQYYVVQEEYMEEFRTNTVPKEHRIYIKVGEVDMDNIEVLEGLTENMRILLWK